MTKQAERPCLIDFRSDAFDDEDLATLQLNANDVVEWETGECIPELGASIFQVAFKGYPIADEGTLTHLGSVLYNACDYGLDIHQMIGDALYEARHPWLDYADAVEKKAFMGKKEYLCLVEDVDPQTFVGTGVFSNWIHFGNYLEEMYEWHGIRAVKPIKAFDFHHFNQVKVYTPE